MKDKVLFIDGKVAIYKHHEKGFCVLANKDLRKDELITCSPVCVINPKDVKKSSSLDAYPIYWDKKKDCIAFGCINLLNHDLDSNVRLE